MPSWNADPLIAMLKALRHPKKGVFRPSYDRRANLPYFVPARTISTFSSLGGCRIPNKSFCCNDPEAPGREHLECPSS
jgi:hypothetical protein